MVGEECDAGREVDMLERAGAFTMESSAKVFFGMDSQAQRDPNDAFLYHMKSVMTSVSLNLFVKILNPFESLRFF